MWPIGKIVLMTLGQKISKLRKLKGWTQAQLAEKVGVHPSHITRWERDKNQPSSSTLKELTTAFGLSLEEMTEAPGARLLQESLGEDEKLLAQFRMLQDLDDQDRATIMSVIDAFLVKKKMQEALGL
jgi:transcriptional regulator with XRE-family HTH domain